jgi:hypothetical protein
VGRNRDECVCRIIQACFDELFARICFFRELAVEGHRNRTVFAPIKTTTWSDIDVGALLSSKRNLSSQFVENDRGPLVGATGTAICAGFHTYKESKTLALFLHGVSFKARPTIADGIAL